MHAASTILSSKAMEGCSDATSRTVRRNRPSVAFMMFALWTAVTLRLPQRSAYSNAASAMAREPASEIGLIEMAESALKGRRPAWSTRPASAATSGAPGSNSIPA